MKEQGKRNLKNFAVAYVPDTSTQMSLKYLFGVVLKQTCLVTGDFDEVAGVMQPESAPSLALLCCAGGNQGSLELIAYSKSVFPETVVIALDKSGDENFEARAFRYGADDVAAGIGSLKDFAYRVRARCRTHELWKAVSLEDVNWDVHSFVAQKAGLTAAEGQIMHLLVKRDGQILSRDDLSQSLDNRPWTYGDRKFDVHIASLRKKLKSQYGDRFKVQAVRSKGYRLTLAEPE